VNKIPTIIILSFAITATAISGCDLVGEDGTECAAVFAAEEIITIEGREFYLDTSLWINLMPPVPPEGPDLNIVAKITAKDGEDFPDGYTSDYVWLLQGDTIVVLEYVEEKPRELSGNNVMEKVATTKSKLNPETPADVVIRLIDEGGEKHYLRASGQTITITR